MQEGKRSMENDHDSDYHAEEGLLDLSRLSDYSFVDQLHLRDPTSRESDDLLRKPPSPPAVPPPPDGGSLAWLQCAGAFFIYFNTWGFVNSYGVFETFYEVEYLPIVSSSEISWIGSLQAFFLIFGGIVSGPLYDMGYLRSLTITGSFLIVFGMAMTSLATEYWQLILTQGILIGLGNGCLFCPSISILPSYFTTKSALSQGVASAGSGLGGVIYPIMFRRLQPRIGFGWTTRIFALMMLITMLVPVLGLRMRLKPPTRRKTFDSSALQQPSFLLTCISAFFGFLGLYIPSFYIEVFAIQKRIVSQQEDLSIYLLAILNAASIFGRIIPGALADKIGPFNTLAPLAILGTVVAFSWISVSSVGNLIVIAILYGFVSGAFVALYPSCAIALCPSLAHIGVRLGMLFVPISIGLLIGNPIAGALVKSDWTALQSFCGAALAISGVMMSVTRVVRGGWSIKVKV